LWATYACIVLSIVIRSGWWALLNTRIVWSCCLDHACDYWKVTIVKYIRRSRIGVKWWSRGHTLSANGIKLISSIAFFTLQSIKISIVGQRTLYTLISIKKRSCSWTSSQSIIIIGNATNKIIESYHIAVHLHTCYLRTVSRW
jgi:hypothetical protein